MHGLIENKQGKSGHSTSAYLTKALDSWLDPCQWNWQYSYQLKSVLFLRTQTKGAVRRTSWLSSASGRKCWLPSATCLAYSVDVRYVLLFRPAKCEGSSSWWRWLFGESLGKEMKFWKALKDIFIEFYWLGLVFERDVSDVSSSKCSQVSWGLARWFEDETKDEDEEEVEGWQCWEMLGDVGSWAQLDMKRESRL